MSEATRDRIARVQALAAEIRELLNKCEGRRLLETEADASTERIHNDTQAVLEAGTLGHNIYTTAFPPSLWKAEKAPGTSKYVSDCKSLAKRARVLDDVLRALEEDLPSNASIPDAPAYFLQESLYHEIPFARRDGQRVQLIEFFDGTLTTHCIQCGRESVFQSAVKMIVVPSSISRPASQEEIVTDREFTNRFRCGRDQTHELVFHSLVSASKLQKVGQYPSLASLQEYGLAKYRSVLGKRFSDLSRAVGLHAHGVGVGSFIYLRRIFEGLISDAHAEARNDQDWDEAVFIASRMAEKISLLHHHLPEFLVENRLLYGILSKGVHELTEAECMANFEPVRIGIELILDEEIARREKQAKTAAARAMIQSTGLKLGENPAGGKK